MLLSHHTLTSFIRTERIKLRNVCATFNYNPCTSIVSSNSPTNASDETDITTFYNELSSLVGHIPKHNVLIIGRDMNAHIVLYRRGEWYTEKNERLIYLFSPSIRFYWIHTKKTQHNKLRLKREFSRNWEGSKCGIAKRSKISLNINQLIKSSLESL